VHSWRMMVFSSSRMPRRGIVTDTGFPIGIYPHHAVMVAGLTVSFSRLLDQIPVSIEPDVRSVRVDDRLAIRAGHASTSVRPWGP